MNSTILMTMKGQWDVKLIMANTSRWVTVRSVSVYQTAFDTRKHENASHLSVGRVTGENMSQLPTSCRKYTETAA
jgi:hypothetical protein